MDVPEVLLPEQVHGGDLPARDGPYCAAGRAAAVAGPPSTTRTRRPFPPPTPRPSSSSARSGGEENFYALERVGDVAQADPRVAAVQTVWESLHQNIEAREKRKHLVRNTLEDEDVELTLQPQIPYSSRALVQERLNMQDVTYGTVDSRKGVDRNVQLHDMHAQILQDTEKLMQVDYTEECTFEPDIGRSKLRSKPDKTQKEFVERLHTEKSEFEERRKCSEALQHGLRPRDGHRVLPAPDGPRPHAARVEQEHPRGPVPWGARQGERPRERRPSRGRSSRASWCTWRPSRRDAAHRQPPRV